MKILVATNNVDKAREILRVLDADDTLTGNLSHNVTPWRVTCHSSSEEDFLDTQIPKAPQTNKNKVIVKTLAQVGLDSDPEENGKTFAENARIKAYATRDAIVDAGRKDLTDYIIVADDSGLCVDALGGEPGIHSARFAEGGRDDSAHAAYSDNNDKMLAVMRDVPAEKRTAHFVTAVCMLIPNIAQSGVTDRLSARQTSMRHTSKCCSTRCDKLPVKVSQNVTSYPSRYKEFNVEGHLHGHIGTMLIGENGFGYDPLFFPEEYKGKLTNAQLTPEQKTAISHRGKAIRKVAEILQSL